MATEDPVGTALWSIGAGGTAGAAFVCGGLAILRILQQASGGDARSWQFAVFAATLAGGVILATAIAIMLARPIVELWRRAVSGAIAVFLGVLIASFSAVADALGGWVALGVVAVTLGIAAVAAARQARAAGSA